MANETSSALFANPYLNILGISLWKFMIVVAIGFIIFVFIIRNIRKKQNETLQDGDWLDSLFLGFNFYAFIIALVFSFTGQFLFDDRASASIAMGIAALALFLYIKGQLKRIKK